MLRKEETVYPKRIVKSENAENAESLLVEKPIVLTFGNSPVCTLKNGKGERSFILLDLGREIQGSCKIVVPQTKGGQTVKLRFTFGESVTEALSKIGEKGATNDHSPRDFICEAPCASALEFGQTGYRFIKIELLGEDTFIKFQTVAGICKTEPIEQLGYIKTGDRVFDEILQTAIYTCRLTLQDGVLWDGIKRDRFIWSGDLNAGLMTACYAFGATKNVKTSLQILRDASNADWVNWIPSYSAWWLINLSDYYALSGDLAFVKESVPFINAVLADFDACVGRDGEIDFSKCDKATNMPFYFDWQSHESPDAKIGVAMLIVYAARKILRLGVSGICFNKAESLVKKLSVYETASTDYKQILAIQSLCGGKTDVKEALERNGAAGFSMFASYFLFSALFDCGSKKTVEIAKEYYGGMLSRGATTFWEDFDVEWLNGSGRIDEETPDGVKDLHADFGRYCYTGLRHSLCHCWSSGIVAFAFEKIVGVRILETGFKRIKITPNLCGLQNLEAKFACPQGVIFVRVKDGKTYVEAPDGVQVEY